MVSNTAGRIRKENHLFLIVEWWPHGKPKVISGQLVSGIPNRPLDTRLVWNENSQAGCKNACQAHSLGLHPQHCPKHTNSLCPQILMIRSQENVKLLRTPPQMQTISQAPRNKLNNKVSASPSERRSEAQGWFIRELLCWERMAVFTMEEGCGEELNSVQINVFPFETIVRIFVELTCCVPILY